EAAAAFCASVSRRSASSARRFASRTFSWSLTTASPSFSRKLSTSTGSYPRLASLNLMSVSWVAVASMRGDGTAGLRRPRGCRKGDPEDAERGTRRTPGGARAGARGALADDPLEDHDQDERRQGRQV